MHSLQFHCILQVEVELVPGEHPLLPLHVLGRDDAKHHHILVIRFNLKRTVSIISSETPCKDGNARFRTAPFKLCLIKNELDINVFVSFTGSLRKWLVHFLPRRSIEKINIFRVSNRRYLPHFWNLFFKGTVLNRAMSFLHRWSLKITLTVPLTQT